MSHPVYHYNPCTNNYSHYTIPATITTLTTITPTLPTTLLHYTLQSLPSYTIHCTVTSLLHCPQQSLHSYTIHYSHYTITLPPSIPLTLRIPTTIHTVPTTTLTLTTTLSRHYPIKFLQCPLQKPSHYPTTIPSLPRMIPSLLHYPRQPLYYITSMQHNTPGRHKARWGGLACGAAGTGQDSLGGVHAVL